MYKNTEGQDLMLIFLLFAIIEDKETKLILDAMEDFHNRTCIRFKPKKDEDDYILIQPGNGYDFCVKIKNIFSVTSSEFFFTFMNKIYLLCFRCNRHSNNNKNKYVIFCLYMPVYTIP